MTKYVNIGATLEAEHADARSRKIEWKGPKAHPVTKKVMMLYECDRNSFVEIIKACDSFSVCECCVVGDQLEADAISVYIETKRKLRVFVKEGVTGRHGAQFINIRNKNISTIKTPLHNLRKSLELTLGMENKKDILIKK